jgi:hypothetical protein
LLSGGLAGTGHEICWGLGCFGRVLERCDPQVNVGHFETGDLDVEIEPQQQAILELLRQEPVVPHLLRTTSL